MLGPVAVHYAEHLGEVDQGSRGAIGITLEEGFERAAGDVLDHGEVCRTTASAVIRQEYPWNPHSEAAQGPLCGQERDHS